MLTFSGENHFYRRKAAQQQSRTRLAELSMETRRDTIAIVLTMTGMLSVANIGYAVHEGMKTIDASSAVDLPDSPPAAARIAHRQEADFVRNLEWQGEGEAGLLALAGIVTYSLLPARRED